MTTKTPMLTAFGHPAADEAAKALAAAVEDGGHETHSYVECVAGEVATAVAVAVGDKAALLAKHIAAWNAEAWPDDSPPAPSAEGGARCECGHAHGAMSSGEHDPVCSRWGPGGDEGGHPNDCACTSFRPAPSPGGEAATPGSPLTLHWARTPIDRAACGLTGQPYRATLDRDEATCPACRAAPASPETPAPGAGDEAPCTRCECYRDQHSGPYGEGYCMTCGEVECPEYREVVP